MYVRNNGLPRRRAELHDPLLALRPPRLPGAAERPHRGRRARRRVGRRRRADRRCSPAGFGCPCHGGQYDTEGNRTAGPPVRALDRYEFSIIDGSLVLGTLLQRRQGGGRGPERGSRGTTAAGPGVHVDGLESWLYPSRRRGRWRRSPAAVAAARRRRCSYPLDWLEERSGLVGGIKYFLFRKVPRDIELVAHARLGDADRVPRAGGHRRDPRDVLQAGSRHGLRVDPVHHERRRRSAGSCAACTAGARASSSS